MVGKVIDGKIVVDTPLEEGSTVTVVTTHGEGSFELDAESESALLEAVAEADRGVFVDGDDLLRELRSMHSIQ